ncbi:hypothetical protein Q8W71_27320 [Methylobacterium sp. NEAU 140]|uniref:tail fiber domain-containing protein n=1 Tax=Methylobacterium sp. NEAU 140 TaxID=3064945 RepID=UPI0027361ECF|nr:tail fiber domain-containing protein [Methylobacterium sp. NEAU 140]MDP4026339.1 hypothetical protein [Methylobacterium sp. NEAU 140]
MGGAMGGGQTQTENSTQVSTRNPWDPAIPGLQRALTDADALYTNGVGGQIYGGQRVAGLTEDQSRGIISTRDQAAADNAGPVGVNFLQNLMGSGGGVSYNGPALDGNGLSAGTVGALGNLAAVKGVSTAQLQGLADRLKDPNSAVNQTANAFMSGARDLTTEGDLRSLLSRALAPSAAETNLSSTAAGAYLDPTANPWVSKLAQVSADNALNATKQAYAASGRYGSGNFAGATTKAVNDTQSALFADQYDKERTRQLSANSQIDSARQAGTQLGSGIVDAISGVQSTNNSQRLAGAGVAQAQTAQEAGVLGQILGGDEFNSGLELDKAKTALGTYERGTTNAMANEQNRVGTALSSQGQALQAAGLLPALDALRYAPAQNLLGVGQLQRDYMQQSLDSAQDYFNETQTRPWQLLGQYASYPMAIGQQGGTTVTQGTSQRRTSGQSPLQTILGLGTGLLGLGTGGGSTLGGGLLGGLLGSDERLKENIREVGALADGTPVHAYNMKGDDRTQIGLLADQVAQRHPEAVGPIGIGDILGVDYGRATADAAATVRASGRAGRPPQVSGPVEPGIMSAIAAVSSREPAPLPRGGDRGKAKPPARGDHRKAA